MYRKFFIETMQFLKNMFYRITYATKCKILINATIEMFKFQFIKRLLL